MLKIEPSEITSFFLQQFFSVSGGGGVLPVFPPYASVYAKHLREEVRVTAALMEKFLSESNRQASTEKLDYISMKADRSLRGDEAE